MRAELPACLTCTVPEAGRMLGIGRDAAYRAASEGIIPTLRLGRRLVVPVPKLMALVGLDPEMSEAGPASPAAATTDKDSGGPRHDSGCHNLYPRRIA